MFRSIFCKIVVIGLLFIAFHAYGLYQNGNLSMPSMPGLTENANSASVALPGHSIRGMREAADPADCVIVKKSVPSNIDSSRYPLTANHAKDAIRAGEARILHLDREGAEANRDQSLTGIATHPGKDRDEYPPAATMEGGAGANVRLIDSSDNRGAGSSMGAQLGDYCSGQAFVLTTQPR